MTRRARIKSVTWSKNEIAKWRPKLKPLLVCKGVLKFEGAVVWDRNRMLFHHNYFDCFKVLELVHTLWVV